MRKVVCFAFLAFSTLAASPGTDVRYELESSIGGEGFVVVTTSPGLMNIPRLQVEGGFPNVEYPIWVFSPVGILRAGSVFTDATGSGAGSGSVVTDSSWDHNGSGCIRVAITVGTLFREDYRVDRVFITIR